MNLRAVAASFRQQALHFIADPQWIIPSLISPFLFAMVMLFINRDITGPIVLQAVLGGGVLGMWANTLFASSYTISYDRMNGTFETLLLSPTKVYDVLIGRSIWNAFIGIVNALLVFIIAELIFHTDMTLADPVGFFLTLTLTLFSLASLGMLISTAFVFSRMGRFFSSIAEYPIYVLSGALVPISILPQGLQYASFVLAPAWGVDAIKYTALEGYSSMMGVSLLTDVIVLIALSVVVLVAAYFIMNRAERAITLAGSATRY